MTELQLFALLGLVMLVATLVLIEMFERAIQRDLERYDDFNAARTSAERAEGDGDK